MQSEKPDKHPSDATRAARMLEDEILSGDIRPGARLYIRELMARTGLGATPLREGAIRLVARGLVRIEDQRGFYVADFDPTQKEQYLWCQTVLEQATLRRSIARRDAAWSAAVRDALAAFGSFTPDLRARRTELTRRYCDLHKAFHMALVSACGVPCAINQLDILFDQETRLCHAHLPEDDPLAFLRTLHDVGFHAALAECTLDGDVETACGMVIEDRNRLARALGLPDVSLT